MIRLIVYPLALIIVFAIYIKYIESRSIFFPTRNIDLTPADIKIPFENIYLKTTNNTQIHGWFIPFEGAHQTILFCHGNGGNVSHRLEKIILLRRAKVNILIFDYQGYGNSQGKPSEKAIYKDTSTAYNYLVKERGVNPKDIILYGESLGCAAAIDLAAREPVGGLILEGAFSSGRDMARIIYPFLPNALFFSRFNSIGKIDKVVEPKLFIHSTSDEIVPYSLAQKLFKAAKEPKQFIQIRGGHNTAFIDSQEDYTAAIITFSEELE